MASKPYYTLASLAPNNSVGYLLKRCGLLLTQIAERRFEALSISFTQWMTLMWLSSQQAPVSATQLSTDLGHDMGALTRVVDELERLGFVRRERSHRDRRAVEIEITSAGRRQAQSAKRVIVELLNQLVAPFSSAEVDTLVALLQRLLGHLQDATAPRGTLRREPRVRAAQRNSTARGAA
ncbi:MAG TPA: MarR family transcriptional regulator [Steroidobacteraceae bacterium]|nr:MarR family transcriptional regulator [Steroidobacteraceae bacterium]